MLNTQSSGQRTALAANSTQASFSLTSGRYAVALASGVYTINDGTNTHTITPMGIFRGVQLGFGGVGADNTTANYRVWLVRFAYAPTAQLPNGDPTKVVGCEVNCYVADTSTVTLSTYTGIVGDSDVYLDAQRIADTVTMTLATTATTPRGIGTANEAAFQLGAATAYSPANNVPGSLIIPHMCGAHGFIVEFNMNSSATSMNYVYELTL